MTERERERERDYSNYSISYNHVTKEGLISVIIPVYCTELYLRRCLDSIVDQTYRNLEIICINDCSPDNSLQILREYEKQDNRIKVIDFENGYKQYKGNQGVSIARNVGLEMATGEYIGFVDSDDWIDNNFYEELIKRIKESNGLIVKANAKNNTRIFYKTESKYFIPEDYVDVKFGFFTFLYRKDFLSKNNFYYTPKTIMGQDQKMVLLIFMTNEKVDFVDNVYYNYTVLAGSASIGTISENKIISFSNEVTTLLLFLNENIDKLSRKRYIYLHKMYLLAIYYYFLDVKSIKLKRYILEKMHIFYKTIPIEYKRDYINALIKDNKKDIYEYMESEALDEFLEYKLKIMDYEKSPIKNTLDRIQFATETTTKILNKQINKGYSLKISIFKVSMIKIKRNQGKTNIKLFGIIPLLKITKKQEKIRIRLFGIIPLMEMRDRIINSI